VVIFQITSARVRNVGRSLLQMTSNKTSSLSSCIDEPRKWLVLSFIRWKFLSRFYPSPHELKSNGQRGKKEVTLYSSSSPFAREYDKEISLLPSLIREEWHEWKCRTCARDWPAHFLGRGELRGVRCKDVHARGRRNISERNGWSGRERRMG
jgi:hypothetical protein